MSLITFWLTIYSPLRLAILAFLFLWLFRRILVFAIKKAGTYLCWLLQGIVIALFFVVERILILLFKIFRNLLNPINHLFEESKSKALQGMPRMRKKWENLWKDPIVVKKKYKMASLLIPVLLAIITHQWPESKAAAVWYENEEAFLREKLEVQPLQPEEARAAISVWADGLFADENVGEEQTQTMYQLQSGYEGGHIRQGPSKSTESVAVIAPQEPVVYLGEEAVDDRGITWYKVETQQGTIGWISTYIIEAY